MAKKHKHPEHENHERWLVSYADFITLLFATFTALYALSQTDLAKFKDVATAIREGFAEQSLLNGINSILQGKTQDTHDPDAPPLKQGAGTGVLDKFESMTYQPGEVKRMEQTAQAMSHDFDQMQKDLKGLASGEDKDVPIRPTEVSVQERGIRISFDSRLLFAPGSAVLRQESKKALDTVAVHLLKYEGNVIYVEGHTDDLPISSAIYPSNWELSAARASTVIRYLTGGAGLSDRRFVALGYGSTQPLTTNKTAAGRARNRRVDLIILNRRMSQLASPREQFRSEVPLVKSVSSEPYRVIPPRQPKPAPVDKPVHVIIQNPDGSKRIFTPNTTPVTHPDKPEPAHPPAHP